MKKSDIAILEILARGETVGASRLKGELLERLRDEHLIVSVSHGSRVSYRALDPSMIEVPDLSFETRADQVAAFGDSKAFYVRSCPGFPVNSYVPIHACLDGRPLDIYPDEGTFMFVSDWQKFTLPEDVVVVGVENMENFRKVRSQRYLFQSLCAPVLFVSRYPQTGDLVHWLQTISNRYVHFGDLDLAGVNIYLTEFYNRLGERASFFIPFDADERLRLGSRERYDNQIARFGHMAVPDTRVQYLVDLIHKHKKGYDQEGYIV